MSIINCPLSTIHCQLSIINCPLSTVHYQLSIVNCPLSTVHCQLSIINCQLSIINCPLSTIHYPLSTVHCQLSIVNCPLSTVNCSFIPQRFHRIFQRSSKRLNHKPPLFTLANKADWNIFEQAFLPLYYQDKSRPAKPIRLMVGLLLLKPIRNISDESALEQRSENNYSQYFCAERAFIPCVPWEASELVHFR